MSKTLEVKFLGTTLKNPIMTASGTFGYGIEFSPYMDVGRLGGIISKGLTLHPKAGNDGIRIWETPSGIMNSIGLQNPGVHHFIEEELHVMQDLNDYVVANLGGNTLDDYKEGIRLLDATDVDAIELNISCPNVKHGGMAFGIRCEDAELVVSEVRPLTSKPMIVKLSPNAYTLVELAKRVEGAGADAVSLVNTFNAMVIDIFKRRTVFNNKTAGLSGPAIRPIALRMVYEVAKGVDIPVVGIGGIDSWESAIEFIMAGATTLQIGTANLTNPTAAVEIIDGMEAFCQKEGIQSLDEIRGII
ncbi:MAG: dihydroorotate dehydrogenase [Tissierellia bacterium]|nr:dihydroorotate dehydrogenase [Tissierellia bacterium]